MNLAEQIEMLRQQALRQAEFDAQIFSHMAEYHGTVADARLNLARNFERMFAPSQPPPLNPDQQVAEEWRHLTGRSGP